MHRRKPNKSGNPPTWQLLNWAKIKKILWYFFFFFSFSWVCKYVFYLCICGIERFYWILALFQYRKGCISHKRIFPGGREGMRDIMSRAILYIDLTKDINKLLFLCNGEI